MLNALSAESNPDVPDNRKLAAIDTIVLTHDDADHKQGTSSWFTFSQQTLIAE
jgi:beta-lactamase superfamily II metal-dependent hydrolase